MGISAIIAAYNEEKTIAEVLERPRRASRSSTRSSSSATAPPTAPSRSPAASTASPPSPSARTAARATRCASASTTPRTTSSSSSTATCSTSPTSTSTSLLGPVLRDECDMNIGVRNRGPIRNFFHLQMKCGPVLSGIRVMRRDVWDTVPLRYQERFKIEAALNFFCSRAGFRQRQTVIYNLGHVIKESSAACCPGSPRAGNDARSLPPPLRPVRLRDLALRRRGRAGRRVRPLRVVRRTTAAVLALSLLTACTCIVNLRQPARILERSVVVNGHTFKYRVWLPPHFTKLRRWPVILFLHGSGERGDDNLRQLTPRARPRAGALRRPLQGRGRLPAMPLRRGVVRRGGAAGAGGARAEHPRVPRRPQTRLPHRRLDGRRGRVVRGAASEEMGGHRAGLRRGRAAARRSVPGRSSARHRPHRRRERSVRDAGAGHRTAAGVGVARRGRRRRAGHASRGGWSRRCSTPATSCATPR